MEGYVLHSYGPERYVTHAVAAAATIRRYDTTRPIALYCPPEHKEHLKAHDLDTLFSLILPLPEEYRSIVGFKHNLDRFMPFERCLFLDADMIWCRDPEPLWQMLGAYSFTATGLARADFFFGGPKGIGVVWDVLLDRRRKTLERFNITHLPRVQAGMIYAGDQETCRAVCEASRGFLAQRGDTHFRSRLDEGRSEESCEWSMAMAMSRFELPVLPWFQGYNSPQLDFIGGLTVHDDAFRSIRCVYYSDPFLYNLRGIKHEGLRNLLIKIVSSLPGRGDRMLVTPFALHFGWLHHKEPFYRFAERTWQQLTSEREPLVVAAG